MIKSALEAEATADDVSLKGSAVVTFLSGTKDNYKHKSNIT